MQFGKLREGNLTLKRIMNLRIVSDLIEVEIWILTCRRSRLNRQF
jgi:hypothetical protein